MRCTALALIVMFVPSMSGHLADSAQAPQPAFTMSISLTPSTVDPGAEVIMDIDLTNTSGKEIRIVRLRYGPPLYRFRVLDLKNGKPAPLTAMGEAIVNGNFCWKGKKGETRCLMGGSASDQLVAPGGTLHDIFCLSDYVDFRYPSQYRIRLERTDPYTKLIVNSNWITATVGKEK